MDESQLMDMSTLDSLKSVLEEGIYELFDEFITDSPSALERLDAAINNTDYTEIREAAHYLKGSGGNIGASAFAEACRVLEQQALEKKLQNPAEQLDKIRILFSQTVDYMKKQSG